METPEREPMAVLDKTLCLSGPASACAAFCRSCDQAVSPRWLAPSWAALKPVSLGHGLEILTILWGANRARGSSFGSRALILMGGRYGDNLNPNEREPGHTEARKVA
jgi:hypothetical protein